MRTDTSYDPSGANGKG